MDKKVPALIRVDQLVISNGLVTSAYFCLDTYFTSLVPRLSCGGGGERAWYTLFAHVPSSLGNLHTTPLH